MASGAEAARQRANEIATAAGPGWRVEKVPRWPWGWDLIPPEGKAEYSGTLDRLAAWLRSPYRERGNRADGNPCGSASPTHPADRAHKGAATFNRYG